MKKKFDIIIVGGGIIGLAHAYWALQKGYSVAVFDQDNCSNGASVLNFGFITVTGQEAGKSWSYAKRSAEVWKEIVPVAGIKVLQEGLCVLARRDKSEAVIDAFLKTEMAHGCEKWSYEQCAEKTPIIKKENQCGLYSPHEIRVESKEALPQLVKFLQQQGVEFFWNTRVSKFLAPEIETTCGHFSAKKVIVCPGDRFAGLSKAFMTTSEIIRCKLQMMRIRPEKPITLPHVIMSDLGLARYHGYADLVEGAELGRLLDKEQAEQRNAGIHLIIVQSKDGSLIVGDSHEYSTTPNHFNQEFVNRLILDELEQVIDLGDYQIEERWVGTYASHPKNWLLEKQLNDDTHLIVVTAGNGASTSFGIAENTLNSISL